MKAIYAILTGIALLPVCAGAQQKDELPSRSMTIEGLYSADVTDAGKIMPAPEKYQAGAITFEADYATDGRPYMGLERKVMSAPSAAVSSGAPLSGLVKAGYGINGDMDVLADLRIKSGKYSSFAVDASATGWNSMPEDNWRSRLYDTSLDLGYSYRPGSFRIDVDGNFGYSYANFRPEPGVENTLNPNRNIFTGGLDASVSASRGKVDCTVGIGWDIFLDQKMPWTFGKGVENLLKLNGNVSYDIDGTSSVQIDAYIKAALYDCSAWKQFCLYDNVTTLSFTPKYTWKNGKMVVEAGANLAFRIGLSPVLNVSPKVYFGYRLSRSLNLYADITGGLDEYDMSALKSLSPYWISREQITDGYTRINASMGALYNPVDGLGITLRGGYRWYSDRAFQIAYENMLMASYITQANASQVYAGLAGRYVCSDRLSAYASVEYDKWNSLVSPEYLLTMLPELDVRCGGEVEILPSLKAGIDYRYAMMTDYGERRLPCISDLGITAGYSFSERLDVSLTGSNLLNHRHYMYAGYRNLGISFAASLLYRF